MWKIFVISIVLLFIGCFPMINHYQTGQTAPKGHLQVGGSFSPYYYSTLSSEALLWPITRLDFKYGITDRLDIGTAFLFNYIIPGIAFNAKYQVLSGNFDGAVLLDGSYSRYSYTIFNASATDKITTLRPTFVLSRDHQGGFPFSIAMGLHYWHVANTTTDNEADTTWHNKYSITALTLNLGVPIRFGSMRFMPEIGLWMPFIGSASIGNENNSYFLEKGNPIFQAGAYMGYDGKRE